MNDIDNSNNKEENLDKNLDFAKWKDLPECFIEIKDIFDIIDDKLYFSHNSTLTRIFALLGFLFYFPIIIHIFSSYKIYITYNIFTTILSFIIAFVFFIIVFYFTGDADHIVIDYKNKKVYSEFRLLGFRRKYNFLNIDNIEKIGNNVTYSSWPNHRHHPTNNKTNLYHVYYLSLFTKNGRLINYIYFGEDEKSYIDSKKFALALAKFLNVPAVICNDDQYLVVKKIVKILSYKDVFKLEVKDIPREDV